MNHSLSTQPSAYATGDSYFVQSYAKINLTLDVSGRRSDGYHDLLTIMQTINLSDILCLTARSDDQVRILCSRSELSTEENLAFRAAQSLRKRLGLTRGVEIELHKRVPMAAGLGGGSSNAAAVLVALRDWWKLPLSNAELVEIAATLGSDVPFFIDGGLALCEGRGELITRLPDHWPSAMRWVLLLKPSIGVSTATVFRNLSPADYSDGRPSHLLQKALLARQPFATTELYNSLERGVLEHYPEVARAQADLLAAGADYVRLSGSGPTLFTSFEQLTEAQKVYQRLQNQGYELYLTHAIHPQHHAITYF
ncbi:4-(cytidine 5'-diphospho)-2-C-methyl-D-erythritol kinase [Tengunoibacter tsumagoiensis]|uniref:4-diphosphocytidyl-2-C-methyl-D-erythritol kinase n=1 Tax=Tengunoibacter tsumagoiensis TaxID=2014871 RepID=A0A402A366_9CHLR|nr:4-(cytidine 5'-diphospho)-2-C-methyl-D-erythritol kinase [Tengunoibacter tsumagoiensis]GCE13476.1 4-diphosphocytidyl-2-C-methyl-D-erythritol kinase [Tengunoibacter tsumagoiensis]